MKKSKGVSRHRPIVVNNALPKQLRPISYRDGPLFLIYSKLDWLYQATISLKIYDIDQTLNKNYFNSSRKNVAVPK